MAELKTLHGILALVDIVNFTGQATKLGNQYTGLYTEYFQQKVTGISGKYGFRVIKSIGDAVLLFGADVEGLLDIMLDLFQRDKLEDNYGFISRFRMVAHSGFFQFKMENNQLVDLVSPQGIMVFRLEKEAEKWELAVTPALYDGVKSFLTQKQLEAHRMELREPLKGFDGREWGNAVYKLRIVKGRETAANLLEPRLEQLEKQVQYIPVFGNIYPPVPMEINFINLSLVCDDERFLKEPDHCRPDQNKQDDRKKRTGLLDEMDIEHEFSRRTQFNGIDVPFLYEKFRKGIIMGLPGAGKTTILRNIAYREFKKDETREEGKKQVTLFAPCANAPLYNEWHTQYYGEEPTLEISPEDALDYLTWVFLLEKKVPNDCSPGQLAEYRESANRVKLAFKENRVTLLVDALDEAADILTREKIKEVFITLYTHASKNRLYMTSRPSENIHLAQDIRRHHIPLFKVLSLTMEQVRAMAGHLMEEDSDIYKKFDRALWQEEMVLKMAATPIMALLVTAYFQAYEKFDHRYPMYDLLLKFILLRAWDNIKTGMFPYKNMDLFFQEIKSPDFFTKHNETRNLYDALAALCFNLFYDDVDGKVRRSVTEEELNKNITTFILKSNVSNQYGDNAAESLAAQWWERFHRDHLLLQAGAGKYVFVHSTVMEFLAAYYLVEKANKDSAAFSKLVWQCAGGENFLELETVPIAAGSSLTTGFDLLRDIGKLVNETSYRDHVYRLGVKCLSEVEWLLNKTFIVIRMKSMRKPIDDIVDRNRLAVKWVYLYLKDVLLTQDKEQLKENARRFDSVLKLSRPTFLEEFLDYNEFDKGDSELVELRRQLLLKVVQKELVEKWFEKHQKETLTYENVLQLDTPQYHPDDKNFNYYHELIGKEFTGFFGSPNFKHFNTVRACVFLPDGKRAVSASSDNTLKLWDVETGKEIRTFSGHSSYVNSCSAMPDGRRIISASADDTLKMWDVETGKEIRTFIGHSSYVNSCSVMPDSQRIISASYDTTLKLWDVETGKEIRTFSGHKEPINGCTVTPDGQHIISASADKTLKLWDVETGKEIRAFKGHLSHINNCAVTPDGQRVISASNDTALKLWDVETGKEIRSFTGHQNSVNSCAAMPDSRRLVSASYDKTLKLWDIETGKEIRTFSGHKEPINGCAVTPDGRRIISASDDNTLKLWDVEIGREIRSFNGHNYPVNSCAATPDGRRIISASDDNTLKLWDVETGKEIHSFLGHKYAVNSCTVMPNSRCILSASSDKTLKLWDIETGKEIRSFSGHIYEATSCATTPDGRRIISASRDHTLKLWDVETGEEIRTFTGHQRSVTSCAALPDGRRIISASSDRTFKLWDMETGKKIHTFNGHTASVLSCAITPEGRRIISASSDNTLKLWDVETGKTVRTYSGHKGAVYSCAATPDGRRLLSASSDKTLKLWDIETGQCLKTLPLPWIPRNISISPVQPWKVFTANLNGTVTVFEFDELK